MFFLLDRYVDGVSLAAWMATVFGIIFKETGATRQHQLLTNLLPDSQGTDRRAITFENGMVKYMAPEGEIVQVDARQPMQQTPEFIRQMFRMIGQPFDMPLEVLARDMSTVNFASARIGLLPFYRACRIRATRFGTRWSRTIRWWLSREKQRSKGDPKRWKTEFPERYWAHELLTNEWDYTDPVSEAQADQLQIDMGIKSRKMVIAERGRDMEQIDRDLDEDDRPEVKSTMTRDVVSPSAPAPVGGRFGKSEEEEGSNGNGNGRAAGMLSGVMAALAEKERQPQPINVHIVPPPTPTVTFHPNIEVNIPEQPSQPAPVVTFEPGAIAVNTPDVSVAAPIINVQSPEVTVQPPDVQVDVAAPVVNVEPAQVTVQPPDVTVNMPPQGKRTKTIEYNAEKDPIKITEEDAI